MRYNDIPERKKWLEPDPEPDAVYTCDICGESIFEGAPYYEINDIIRCQDCVNDIRRLA